ncbi:MAG TPA: DUF5677 domain-containing protein [Variovorax sp.]|nr:DUF5677 domain-containing protein [Variovorax sp.]
MSNSILDHDFADGFLSDAARNLRDTVHAEHGELVKLHYASNRLAVGIQHLLDIHPERLQETTAAALYARSLASTQGAVLLLEHGLPTQAKTVLRSALEALFPLCAIEKKPELASTILDTHDHDKRALVDKIRRWDSDVRAAIPFTDEELDVLAQGSGKELKLYDVAKHAGMEQWYLVHYALLSFSAHVKVSTLDRHVVVVDQDRPIEFKNEPEIAGQYDAWMMATQVLLVAMRAVSNIFSLECDAIGKFGKRLIDLTQGPSLSDAK